MESIQNYLVSKSLEERVDCLIRVDDSNRYPFGKLLVRVDEISDLVSRKNIAVSLEIDPYILSTSIVTKRHPAEWK